MKRLSLIIFTFVLANSSFAQVPVRDEPRHHNVFENSFVRILDVSIKPGDTTLYHLHNTPSVFIYFTASKVGSNLLNKPASSNINIAGNISYDSLKIPRIHRVWNEDTSWFHVMDIEMVNPKPAANYSYPEIKNAELLFDKIEVRGYRLQLKEDVLAIKKSDQRFLLISIGNATLNVTRGSNQELRVMKPGHYIWIQSNENVVIKNLNSTAATFALLEIK